MNKKQILVLVASLCLLLTVSANASPIIPGPADWTKTVTTLIDRGSPAATTSVTDLAPTDGVLLEYDAATGGTLAGTSRRQYDFETTASATGLLNLSFDADLHTFNGFYQNELALYVLQNGAVAQTLYALNTNAPVNVNQTFDNVLLNLTAGDTWGIRAIAGNYDAGSGVWGDIYVTSSPVPEPATMFLLGSGLIGLAGTRRKFKKK